MNSAIKKVFGGAVGTKLFAAWMSMVPVNDANAQSAEGKLLADASLAKTEAPATNIGILDLRKKDVKEAKVIASGHSAKHVVILYMGDNEESYNKARTAGALAKSNGVPIKGLALAKEDGKFGQESLIILMGHVAVSKQFNPSEYTVDEINQLISDVYNKYSAKIGIVKVAENQGPQLAGTN